MWGWLMGTKRTTLASIGKRLDAIEARQEHLIRIVGALQKAECLTLNTNNLNGAELAELCEEMRDRFNQLQRQLAKKRAWKGDMVLEECDG